MSTIPFGVSRVSNGSLHYPGFDGLSTGNEMKMGPQNGLQFLPTVQESLIEQEVWGQLSQFYARSNHVISWRARGSRECLDFIDPLVESWFGQSEKHWCLPGFWEGRVHPDDLDAFRAFSRGPALETGLHRYRYRMVTDRDETVWIEEVSCVRPVSPDDRLICGMFIDVSREQELTEEVLRISNFERERLGQDLHDDFCQDLAGIACLSRRFEKILEKESPANASFAREITEQINQALQHVRALSHSLSPLQLEDGDLVEHLEKLTRETEQRAGIECRTSLDPSIQVAASDTRLHLFRLSQEAIRNAVSHGRASRVSLSLAWVEDSLCRLTIRDNGRGFPDRPTSQEGLGIRLMKHRCRQFGGTLNLSNAPDGGAIVECVFSNP